MKLSYEELEKELETTEDRLAASAAEVASFRAGNTALLEALMMLVMHNVDAASYGELIAPRTEPENNAMAVLVEAGMATETAEGRYFALNWDALEARKPKRQTWAEAVHECVTDPQEIARLMALDDEVE